MKHRHSRIQGNRTRQGGVALIVALILLLTMTLIGLTAMRTTTQEERMAGNFRDRNMAFQAAESGLMAGETTVGGSASFSIGGPWLPELTEPVDFDSLPSGNAWEPWDLIGELNELVTFDVELVAQNPEFIIQPAGVAFLDPEKQYTVAEVDFENFRVTSRGYGASENSDGTPQSQVILQTLFLTDFIGGSL